MGHIQGEMGAWISNSLLLTVSQELRPQDSIPFLRRVSAEVQRSDIRSLSFADDDRPASPRSITSLASAAADAPPRAHDFVKSTFAQGEIHHPFYEWGIMLTRAAN